MPESGARGRLIEALRHGERFLLCTHEHPDGDALGSLVAFQHLLTAMGKDAVSYLHARELPLPYEYRFLRLGRMVTEAPRDAADRILVFLDCGNEDRNPDVAALRTPGATVLNVDHHHDNTRFGTIDLVDAAASSTAEVVWTLLGPLEVPLTRDIAEALYVGLVTDTGRFSYENTGPAAHRMAAELHEAGVDAQAVYRQLFENVPPAKLDLLARGLANLRRLDEGRLTLTHLTLADYAETGAEQTYSEGIVDHLRALQGTIVAALVRDQVGDQQGLRKVSLRAVDDRVDVSAIARAHGGGGHRRAAGFTTAQPMSELAASLREAVALQLGVPVA